MGLQKKLGNGDLFKQQKAINVNAVNCGHSVETERI